MTAPITPDGRSAERLRALFTRAEGDIRHADIKDAIVDVSHILNASDWAAFDALLRDAPTGTMPLVVMGAMISTAWVICDKFAEWDSFVDRCSAEERRRGSSQPWFDDFPRNAIPEPRA